VAGGLWTIVVAGGSGSRLGGTQPKQLADIGDRRMIDWSIDAAAAASDGVVVVLPSDHLDAVAGAVAGGATRAESVRAGLAAVPGDAEIVLVHDAARPFADASLFARVVDAVRAGADAVVPGVALADTIKQVDAAGVVVATPDRSTLRAVQTPQGFRAAALRAAHASGGEGTDDAQLVEAAGGSVVVVEGDEVNRKITRADDLAWARQRVGRASGIRIGQGFDVHRFSNDPERPLILGGVRFDGPGLEGHSDADVVAHAITDAILGAAGLGDIGQQFPDTDDRFAGADSIVLLARAVEMVAAHGWVAVNVDCSVVCERPKLAPMKAAMMERLSAAIGAPVNVKGRRAEQLGAIGRSEGIVCFANALVTAR
jgi:2-C-methyl-D-erythritol 4-phosphate cytidylyltransferase / 2-C-methyl-D-erythritol 2,4-cyclodiphosphate synthase